MRARWLMVALAAMTLAGCGDGVTQRFEASPSQTYAAFEQGWGRPVRTIREIDGKSVPVVFDVDKTEGKKLVLTYTVDGAQAARIALDLASAEGGKATDVTGSIDIDNELFWQAEGETGPEIDDLRANLALQSMLSDAARHMKEDGTIGYGSALGGLGASARASADPERRAREVERQKAEATRPMIETRGADTSGASTAPMVDPNAAASRGSRGY